MTCISLYITGQSTVVSDSTLSIGGVPRLDVLCVLHIHSFV